ncbi:hypothetical protein Rhe02_02350 [Rhizocola hellebori]|uniref:Nitroreductase domain-containing protein n=1 Tax=Rhizocola hellebori TaxID=1392758 RepID=A0A8J3Q2B8_9ACTN|nr:nitroreductase family protein [Rhizocola hellebori]GIH02168.1 hypothetical protein Rhe02_02350 [Rhizocola hellebori]
MVEPELSAYYTLSGMVVRQPGAIRVECLEGNLEAADDDDELIERIATVLGALNATATLAQVLDRQGLPFAAIRPILAELLEIGALHDVRSAWTYFHHLSGNPWIVPAPMSAPEAYAIDRWAPANAVLPTPAGPSSPVTDAALARRSAHLADHQRVSPQQSMEHALCLAAATYRLGPNGRRPLASGGAMWPLQLWVVGGPGDDLDMLAIDHDRDSIAQVRKVARDEWRELFLPHPEVHQALQRGAATIVIAADPTRTCGKYGNRGWRYALMEAGAAAHHLGLLAAEAQIAARTIGGFYDAPLSAMLGGPLLALLTMLVIA